jgi:diacylglycerol kinase family enzyme
MMSTDPTLSPPTDRRARPRALLVVNPAATTTRTDLRDLIIAALEGTVDLDVQPTRGRGHATELAADAVAGELDAVVVLGGDGTANEALQALAHTPVALGLVPGGGANVLARALGLPADPVGATSRLLRSLRSGRRRRIGLGKADDRLFAFNAGMGFDAAVVARVERDQARKHLLRQLAFVGSALGEWRTAQRGTESPLRALLPDGRERRADIALVANTSPYTFLGPRPLTAHPGAAFDLGLDVLTIEDASLSRLATVLAGALSGGRHVRLPGVHHDHDLADLVLESSDGRALPVHVDGDPLPPRQRLVLTALPAALDVLV